MLSACGGQKRALDLPEVGGGNHTLFLGQRNKTLNYRAISLVPPFQVLICIFKMVSNNDLETKQLLNLNLLFRVCGSL